MKKYTQANRFCVNLTADEFVSPSNFESILGEASVLMQNFKDENGEQLGYSADTIIIPGNSYKLRAAAKKVAGTERTTGSDYNDINIQYGNWNIVVLPEWAPATPKIALMSSEANKQLLGNLFFNRRPLDIQNWVDNHTRNFIWNGRCRFGVGFGTWKHIMLIEQGENAECEALTI